MEYKHIYGQDILDKIYWK